MEYIKAPMNYIGNKYRIMGQIQRWFPKKVDLMVDIFCGGCDVTFNTSANEHIANDLNFFVIEIYKEFQRLGVEETIRRIDDIINEWKLTKEDKEKFAREAKTLDPLEFLALSRFINDYKARFTKADLKFLNSHLGRRAERLLRNVVENFSFDDRPERKEDGETAGF